MTNLSYKCPICGDWQCPGCPSDVDIEYDRLCDCEEHGDKSHETLWQMALDNVKEREEEEARQAMERR